MQDRVFPKLFSKASTGKITWWQASALSRSDGAAELHVSYGYVDQEPDKWQHTSRVIWEGKNIGRSNETSPFEQACLEAQALHQKKQDKGYTTSPTGESDIVLPMLAQDYTKRKHDISWPCFVQPKLDGLRMVARKISPTEMLYTSRGGKVFSTLDHLTPTLLSRMKVGDALDGELFNRHWPLQEIVSRVKNLKQHAQQDNNRPYWEEIQYWVYDLVLSDIPFNGRLVLLQSLLTGLSGDEHAIQPVPTFTVTNEDEMLHYFADFTLASHEGIMLRNRDGLYIPNYRSADLQKYKQFVTEEFRVIGAKQGDGKDLGTVIWKCETADGKPFDVRPRGDLKQRQEWYEQRESYYGKWLTVKYFQLTPAGVPQFPVGLVFRYDVE